ncbi:hypothetical protein PN465_01185 [Nodularia spumigena CS-584]|jgi:cell division protein FtsB|uniref:Uncharacterized protein n=3 Tax=Nodularia spumigena TaxID=70799 RepID=A0A2S0Q7M2_NODSP|nr:MULTISPECIES: hypothetical protein [Cyanophyceae]MDB9357157.1 hypothetical protein [Nodularia spumigena CS-587/03]AHJ28216.1 hypothetical protein NSP_18830 [Nodularia spumigena CCY9414]AVZ30413.1 hypothetical protein BMF81_01963 [Nodularia spumigena UHCC 0039]EAW46042.1 hypothetical protein N9414_10423 [Nodularia spumigena CCY9414]KZL48292.1 hypothetical protein A2T98_18815 [Nodularia spumigena CENA596]
MPTYSSSVSERHSQTLWVSDVTKSYYQDDQQAKLQHLQAEVDSLLQQLQNLKQQRLSDNHPE